MKSFISDGLATSPHLQVITNGPLSVFRWLPFLLRGWLKSITSGIAMGNGKYPAATSSTGQYYYMHIVTHSVTLRRNKASRLSDFAASTPSPPSRSSCRWYTKSKKSVHAPVLGLHPIPTGSLDLSNPRRTPGITMTSQYPGYADETKGPKILAVFWVLTAFTLLIVISRLYIRAGVLRNMGADDWLITASMVSMPSSVSIGTRRGR